ncbi:hypothetical protein L210DRAFT_2812198 [Boletus edulis BED1]|uniref:Uncharacterized protein n=1 Tax=Boletus edulis BED1 TaxID=1328754 RepID=A0AAD4C4T2_BOLED|nr:hypothetical protein L210DRAFT_2812198 [Boletus edulis BED1]
MFLDTGIPFRVHGNKSLLGVNLIEWDENANVHKLALINTVSGQTTHAKAYIVISVVGHLRHPDFQRTQVLRSSTFKYSFHWKHGVDPKK